MSTHSHTDRVSELLERLRDFVSERDWDQYHSPKNLAMALTGEVGELVEHFQWLSEAESRELSEADLQTVREEIADVQIYIMLLADRLGLDLLDAVDDKIGINEAKYPTHQQSDARPVASAVRLPHGKAPLSRRVSQCRAAETAVSVTSRSRAPCSAPVCA